MRVLYHIQGNVFGGAHNQCLQLHGPLAERGIELVALLPQDDGDAAERLRAGGVEVHQLPLSRIRAGRSPRILAGQVYGLWRQAAVLEELLRRLRIDMIQLHGLLAWDGAVAARRAGIPVVWQLIDSRPPMALRRLLVPLVNRSSDVVMTTGTRLLREYPGLTSDPSRWFPFLPPVRGELFSSAASSDQRAADRDALLGGPTQPGTVVLGSLGNLNPQKGFEHLIEAVALLRDRHPEVRLVIRGAASSGHPEYHEMLQARLTRHGFPAGTLGPLPADMSVPRFMAALDLFALTPVRRSEGVPTVLLEAMWAGLPCIAVDVGGVADVVSDRVGALCSPESPAAIAGAIHDVLDQGDARRQAVADNARGLARELFTLNECVNVHERAYRAALGDHDDFASAAPREQAQPGSAARRRRSGPSGPGTAGGGDDRPGAARVDR